MLSILKPSLYEKAKRTVLGSEKDFEQVLIEIILR